MITRIRRSRAEKWDAKAVVLRQKADLIKTAHDRLVNNGGTVSLASFELYASLIGDAEQCERRAARWRL